MEEGIYVVPSGCGVFITREEKFERRKESTNGSRVL